MSQEVSGAFRDEEVALESETGVRVDVWLRFMMRTEVDGLKDEARGGTESGHAYVSIGFMFFLGCAKMTFDPREAWGFSLSNTGAECDGIKTHSPILYLLNKRFCGLVQTKMYE